MSVPIALLQDDFTDNVVSPAWGNSFALGSATYAETGGQARLTLPSATAGSHSAFYRSSGAYDLTGDGFVWNIQTMVSTAVAASATFDLYLDGANVLRWRQLSNAIEARAIVGGVDTQLYTAAWSAATYKYLRIREGSGNIVWESSSNGTSWTARAVLAAPFAFTALYVQFAVACGNVASPGSLRLDDVNLPLPAPSATWRSTTADWSITNRLRPVTLASDGGKQGVLVTADAMDPVTEVLSGTLRYYGGPLGSTSGGYLALTEYASLVLAQASPFPIPVNGRVDLPALVDARYMRLYHRSLDASPHNVYEFVPRRIVQADDIEAESIRAINISAGAVTADKIFVLQLSAITANIGGLTIDTTGYLWQGSGTAAAPTTGLKIFNSGGIGKLSTYNATVEQITLDTDGKLKAGAGTVVLDADGILLEAPTASSPTAVSALKWKNTSAGVNVGGIYGWYDTVSPMNRMVISAARSGGTRPAIINLEVDGYFGIGSSASLEIFGGAAVAPYIRMDAVSVETSGSTRVGTGGGGLNVGFGITGATDGQIRSSGAHHTPRSSGTALFALDGTTQGTALTIANNGTANPFGGTRVFSGLMIISETAVNGNAAMVLIDGGGNVTLIGQAGATWSTTAGTASKTNVYITGSAVTIENKLGSSATYNIMALRTRAS